ncbi:MAG: STAS domain-containing protein [Clostridia bacterium]|nr:STAS domain-containing protein [Clostridia bacterium]
MNITKNQNGELLEMALEGRLDTVTSPKLEKELSTSLNGIKELVFDFAKLEYVSSAGLRVLLTAQKVMNTQGSMKVCHVNENIMEVFEITGFADVLTIE